MLTLGNHAAPNFALGNIFITHYNMEITHTLLFLAAVKLWKMYQNLICDYPLCLHDCNQRRNDDDEECDLSLNSESNTQHIMQTSNKSVHIGDNFELLAYLVTLLSCAHCLSLLSMEGTTFNNDLVYLNDMMGMFLSLQGRNLDVSSGFANAALSLGICLGTV